MAFLFPIVFISGILTVLSPCVLPILPVILGSGLDGKKARIRGIIIGLVVSFTFFVTLLTSIVSLLGVPADTLRLAAAVILGFFGLTMIVPEVWIGIQARLERFFHPPSQLQSKTDTGFGGGLLTGAVLGFVWTPCVGPIIATVITLGSLESFSLTMFALMFVYAIGTAIPLYAIARGGSAVSARLGWYRQNQAKVRQWFGYIIIITAILIATGFERAFQAWVLDNIPRQISDPVTQFENRFGLEEELFQLEEEAMMGATLIESNREKEVINPNVRLQNDPDGAKVEFSELLQGCPFKDCIPAIDDPQFSGVVGADAWLEGDDQVFVLTHHGQTKVYPQRIMNWHEIVNDWFPPAEGEQLETPIAVTFCPLCGTATAFERRVDGTPTEFGVSGKLHNNDLVMYDRIDGNLWQQVSGEAIVGPAARRDELLEPLFLVTIPWSEVKEDFPEALVLTRDTGFSRDYDRYPYGNYEQSEDVFFGVTNTDDRLHPKDWVHGIKVNDEAKAYPEDQLTEGTVITDTLGGAQIEARNDDGIISFKNLDTGEEIVQLRSFWFAWAAFNPGTELYGS